MGAIVIPPILDMLNHAYGFMGAHNANVAAGATPLPAPQATLITALATGIIAGKIDWSMLGIGAAVGVAVVALDEWLGLRGKLRLPPLAVGLGIYLSFLTTATIVVGAVLGHFYNRWAGTQRNAERAKQLGVLVASGLIVGESLFGVLYAGLIIKTGNGSPIAVVGDAFNNASIALGGIAFLAVVLGLYRWTAALAAKQRS